MDSSTVMRVEQNFSGRHFSNQYILSSRTELLNAIFFFLCSWTDDVFGIAVSKTTWLATVPENLVTL